jgi:hypothetical protein
MMIRRKRRAGWSDEATGTSKSLLGRFNRSWRSGSPFVFLAKHTSYPPVTAASGRKATRTSSSVGHLNRRVNGTLKLRFFDMAVSAADLPAAEADRRNIQAGSSE